MKASTPADDWFIPRKRSLSLSVGVLLSRFEKKRKKLIKKKLPTVEKLC